MKLAAALLAGAALAARVQACCTYGDANMKFVNQLYFNQTPPLSVEQIYAFKTCVEDFQKDRGKTNEEPWINFAHSNPGDSNVFGCNADHCYGPSDCKGTNDDANHDQSPRWQVYIGVSDNNVVCPFLQYFRVPGFTGKCGGHNPGRRLAQTQAERNCADRELILNEPLTETAARLSQTFCETGDVGLTFAGATLASLDADKNGAITCLEYGIAKMRTTIEELDFTYLGPSKLPAPFCKLSKTGAHRLASYNEYLGKLTLASLKANTTGVVVTAAQRAAAEVEAAVVGNAAVGKMLDVKDAVAAKLNVTLPGL